MHRHFHDPPYTAQHIRRAWITTLQKGSMPADMPDCTPSFAAFQYLGQRLGAGVQGQCRNVSGSSTDLGSRLVLWGECNNIPCAKQRVFKAVFSQHTSDEKARVAHQLGTEPRWSCMTPLAGVYHRYLAMACNRLLLLALQIVDP